MIISRGAAVVALTCGLTVTATAEAETAASAPVAQSTATGRVESFMPARLLVLPHCPTTREGQAATDEIAPALALVAAEVVGDIVKVGVQAAAGALEQASKERAVGGEGTAAFPFYSLSVASQQVKFNDKLRRNQSYCLVLSIDAQAPGGAPDLNYPVSSAMPDGTADHLHALKLPRPAVYSEALLVSAGDGFVIQPHYLWYAERLKQAPSRVDSTELQVIMATPASGEPAAGAFALARIVLPAVPPSTILTPDMLRYRSSAVMPLRPTTGTVDTRKQAVEAAYTAVEADDQAIDDEKANLSHAQGDLASAAKKTDAQRQKLVASRRQIETLERKRTRDLVKANGLLADNSSTDLGSTTVVARIAFVKDANKFGLAIAEALKGRAPDIGTGVQTALNGELTKASWSAADTTYVQSLTAVNTAQQAYTAALAGTDASVQASTLATLRNAQAAANAAAAALNKPVPYPSLLEQIGRP